MRWAADIDAPGGSTRLSRSSIGDDQVVDQEPSALLAQAQRIAGVGVTLDRYTLARVISSEMGSGSAAELLAIGDADLERARRKGVSVFEHATAGTDRYGRQGSGPRGHKRPVATSQDPTVRHLRAVTALLDHSARGFARGATQYFDPKTQLALWQQGRAAHPLIVLERWTYAKEWKTTTRDAQGRRIDTLGQPGSSGDQPLEWIGCIAGVDTYELMLFRRRTTAEAQAQAFSEARDVITNKGGGVCRADGELAARLGLVVLGIGAAAAIGVLT